jgi:hypothetical protein
VRSDRDAIRWTTIAAVLLLTGLWLLRSIVVYQPLDGSRAVLGFAGLIVATVGAYCAAQGLGRR